MINICAELSSICERRYGRSSKVTAFSKSWSLVIATSYSGTFHGNGRQCWLRGPRMHRNGTRRASEYGDWVARWAKAITEYRGLLSMYFVVYMGKGKDY